jgi:hypothetical protein
MFFRAILHRFCHHVSLFPCFHSSLYQSLSRVVGVNPIFRVFELCSVRDVCGRSFSQGAFEVPAYVILLSWLLLTVQSCMGPLVFSRVLAMTASLSQQSFSIGKDCFFLPSPSFFRLLFF